MAKPAPRPRGRGKKKAMLVTNCIAVPGVAAATASAASRNRYKKQLPHQVMSKPSLPTKGNAKSRRHMQLHHHIATWWMSSSVDQNRGDAKLLSLADLKNDFPISRDGVKVSNLITLSDGENWIVCSFVDEFKPTRTTQADNFLHVSIIKSNRNLYLDPGHIKGGRGTIALDGAEDSLTEDNHEGKPSVETIVALCIDVDDEGHCVTVKDIRFRSPADGDLDAERKKADGLEFFLARRRYGTHSGQLIIENQPKQDNYEPESETADGTLLKWGQKVDLLSLCSGSDDKTTSGSGTDDERDAADEIQAINKWNELRFCDMPPPFEMSCVKSDCKMHHHPIPPMEADVDKEGNLLYHHAEPLPWRQLRVLRDGDRILVRCWSLKHLKSSKKVCCGEIPCVKLEYAHGQHHCRGRHAHTLKSITAQLADADKGQGETLGKQRLLEAKSSDVKSNAKKRFTLNSTSSAEAPTNDDATKHAKVALSEVGTEEDGGHKTKEIRSTFESAKKRQRALTVSGKQEKEGVKDNGAKKDNYDMAKHSFIMGEVVTTNQDFISARTGDDTTTPSAMAADQLEGQYKQKYDRVDAATAGAVVLGATASAFKSVVNMLGGLEDDEKRDSGKDHKPLESHHEDDGETAKRKWSSDDREWDPNQSKIEYMEDALAEPKEGEDKILKAQTPKHNGDNENENNPEHKFSRQPVSGDLHAKSLQAEFKKDLERDESDDSITDVSLTQPFTLPTDVVENTSPQSLSTVQDGGDDSTDCPERGEDVKITVANKYIGTGNAFQTSTAKPGAGPEGVSGHGYKVISDNQPTKPLSLTNKNDDKKVLADIAKASAVSDPAKNEEADGHDSDDLFGNQHKQKTLLMQNILADATGPDCKVQSNRPAQQTQLSKIFECNDNFRIDSDDLAGEEPTRKCPVRKFLRNTKSNNQSDEDNEAYLAETQNDDDVFLQHTQPFLPFKSSTKSPPTERNKSAEKANATEKCKDEQLAWENETLNNDINEERNLATHKKTSTPHTNLLKNTITHVEKPCQIKKSEVLSEDVNMRTNPAVVNELAAKPSAAKDVHLSSPSPANAPQVVKLNKGEEKEPESMKLPPAKELPEPIVEYRSDSRAACCDSMTQKQRIKSSAVHGLSNGATMSCPGGGAVPLPTCCPTPKEDPRHQPKNNLLVSYALQSNTLHISPDASASLEETAVSQLDSAELKREQGKEKVAHLAILQQAVLHKRNGYANFRGRDPNIPDNIKVCTNSWHGYGRHFSRSVMPHHRSKRKREISYSGRRRESNEIIRIMFTGINPTQKHKQMISDIGAQLVDSIEDAFTATHVIASDGKTKLRRTPKLMICVCRTAQILSIDWLEQSAREQRALNTSDFLLLHDREAEKWYKFSMKETLENGRNARLDRGGVLGGWSIYICSGVAGNNAPSVKELNFVVEATGATLLAKVSDVSEPSKTIIITSDPCTNAQRSEKVVKRLIGLGANLFSTSWLFHTIITQEFSTAEDEGRTRQNGRQRLKRKATKNLQINHNRKKYIRKP